MENFLHQNSIYLMMVIGILCMLALALAFVLYVNTSQKKMLKDQMQIQKIAFAHQEELLHSTIMTQEAERKRIARDLHDEIGSKLNVIFLNMHRLKEYSSSSNEIAGITDEVEGIINKTIESTRRISHDLLPPTLEEFGLAEAIRELQFNLNRLDQVNIDFEHETTESYQADKIIELNIFRVLQELISNSIKHGKSSEIAIQLWLTPAARLNYKDSGKGFNMSLLANKKGLGMKNIESRLGMINATYELQSAPGEGLEMLIKWKAEKITQSINATT